MRLRSRDYEAAASTQFLFEQPFSPKAETIQKQMRFVLDDMGVQIRIKSGGVPWASFSSTYSSRRLWLTYNWAERSDFSKAKILAHETVHFRQRKRLGDRRFNVRYLFRPKYRWRYEVQAYREGIRVLRTLGGGVLDVQREADRVIEVLRRTYLLRMNRAQRLRTHEILVMS